MSRQFRSDDTDAWKEGFGKGSLGDITISSNVALGTTHHANYRSFTGTSGDKTGTLNSALEYSGWVLIIQHYGSGFGNWELNFIQNSSSSSTATFKYELQNTYITGAQLITSGDYKNWTINANLTVPAWGGTTGGVVFLHAKESISGSGAILGSGATGTASTSTSVIHTSGGGGRGGSGRNNSAKTGQAYRGDGTYGNVVAKYVNDSRTGGGGAKGDDQVGGGGGNGSAGANGQNPGRTGEYGRGGTTGGNAGLTLMVMGAGGGGGSRYASGSSWGAGGSGGAIIFLLAPTINLTNLNITISGGNGGSANKGSGGGGAGGSCLLKGIDVTLGSAKIVANAGTGPTNDIKAGNGGVGRIHADYSGSISGTTNPTIDTRLDTTIKPLSGGGGAFLFNMI